MVVEVRSADRTLRRLLANCWRLRGFLGEASSSNARSSGLDRHDLDLKPVAVVVLVLVGAPRGG